MTRKELNQLLTLVGRLSRRFPATVAEVELYKILFPTTDAEMPNELKEPDWLFQRLHREKTKPRNSVRRPRLSQKRKKQ